MLAAASHVVIIGASFAGLSAFLMLRKKLGSDVRITLIDRYDRFTYTPGLHECIGRPEHLSSLQFSYEQYYGDDFIQAEITSVDEAQVTTSDGQVITFDYLVLATGSRTNFWGTDDSVDHAYTFRHPEDIATLTTALSDDTNQVVTVVGGGFTGIEVMSVLAQRYSHKTLRLIHSRDQLLQRYGKGVHHRASHWLTARGVEIIYDTKVTDLDDTGVILDDDRTLPSDITIMTAGIERNDETHDHITFSEHTRLQAQDHSHIFICGDVNPHTIGTTAHNAMIEGRRVGRLIADQIQGYERAHPPLHEWKRLALALGTHDGLMTDGSHLIPMPWITGLAKKLIEKRVMYEFMHHVMLPV